MRDIFQEETWEQRMKRWAEEKKNRKAYLNKHYPNKLIQKLDIERLRKIGYAIGIDSTATKKELIDMIICKQIGRNNPIILQEYKGEFYFNEEVNLMKYIK